MTVAGSGTAGQDATAFAERTAEALDRQATSAGALETLSAGSAGAITESAVAVHRHARRQAEQAGAAALETSRSFSSCGTGTTGVSHESAVAQIDQAASSVNDAGQASTLTIQIDELARHAADLAATYERDLLATALSARDLADSYPRAGADVPLA